jgi:SAM-dependent methyltransferase
MAIILLYIFEWFLVVVLVTILLLMFLWMWTGITARVPFVPVPNSILKEINKALDVHDGDVVYDLGCGDARVLIYMARLNKGVKYIGIENGPFPYLLASTSAWFDRVRGKSDVQIIRGDFFNHNLNKATHIFTYLYPQVMDDLLGKFDRELRPGARLVSTTFKFTLKKEVGEVDLARGKNKLARKLYIYEF